MKSPAVRLTDVFRWPLKLIPSNAQMRVLRGPLRGMKWIKGAGPNAYWVGTYEVQRVQAFAAALFPGATVYDIGANVGIYTLLASRLSGPKGMVYAFEPLPRNVKFLRRHVALNHLQNCTVIESAVGNCVGSRRFSAENWEASMAHLAADGEMVVPMTTLDTCIYGEHRLRRPDVLKIDVEGAELEVLEGAHRAITEFHPKIFLEIHGTQLHVDCCAILKAQGYAIEEGYGQLTATWTAK
jgi:FkbM family methyltransferase